MNFKFLMNLFLYFFIFTSSVATAQVIETEQFCKSNNGKDQVIKSKSCDLKVLCNNSRVDVFHLCKGKKSFFSFNPDLLASHEVVTSVNFIDPDVYLTTQCHSCKSYRTRLIKGIPSSGPSTWKIMLESKLGFFKFLNSGELFLFIKQKKCSENEQLIAQSDCFKKEAVKFLK